MTSTMGLQQQAASQDTVDFASYLQSTQCHQTEGQVQGCQKSPHKILMIQLCESMFLHYDKEKN